jgi:hypothetical protein
MNLKFIEPICYKDFVTHHSIHASCEGIYIWGFMSEKKEFVPYYVGKSEKSIYSRIIGHFEKIHKNNTYTIFSEFVYQNLPKYLSQLLRKAKPYYNLCSNPTFKGEILYLNNSCFLAFEYGVKVDSADLHLLVKECTSQNLDELIKKHNPQVKINQKKIQNIFSPTNLFVTYAQLQKSGDSIDWQRNLRIAETCVKFCLKTNTIGDSLSLENIKNAAPSITISSIGNYLQPLFYPISNGIPTIDIQKHNSVYNYNGYC